MAKELSQPERRGYSLFYDQHNREWGAPIELATGHACGPWEARFKAPWLPEDKYIRHQGRTNKIVIDYTKNVADLKDAHNEFDELRFRAAQQEWGTAAMSKMGRTYEEDAPELRRMVGKPPRPIEFPEACLEGNQWVLGFSNTVPKWAYPLLEVEQKVERKYLDADEEDLEKRLDLEEQFDPKATGGKKQPVKKGLTPYQEFVKANPKKSMKEISVLWKEQKAAVATA